VEADPDCCAAMDILGFALYHENGNKAAAPELVDQKRSLDTDSSDTESDAIPTSSKKIRVDDNNASLSLTSIKSKIWEEISKCEGDMEVDKTCVNIEDRGLINEALESMEADGTVMVSEGIIYQVD
jgi:hypothetical protein